MVDEVGAIVGGCVAGGFVFFLILGIIMYHVICKRKHRKRNEQSKFRPITPHSSPTHSQHSTLGPDARLPKVNSTGLWVGAPSMYTGVAPSPAYYYGPGKVPTSQAPLHSGGLIPRASSDPRIPNSEKHHHAPPPPPPRRATSMPKVPVVGMQPRIYHSSQPLAPVFEMPPGASPSNGLEIYDVYQFGGGGGGGGGGNSRSKLVEEKHSKHYYEEVNPSSRLTRSQSDVQGKSKKLVPRSSRSRESSSSSKQAAPTNRSASSSSSRDKANPQRRHAPSPPQPSSSSVILQQQHNRSNSRESGLSSSAPGYRIGMKSKSLDSLDDNLSKSSFGADRASYYNKAFEPEYGRVTSLSGDIIFKTAAPIPPKVAVVAAASSVISSSTPRSSVFLTNGVISGNVSISKDKNSNDINVGENEVQVDTSATDSMKLLAKNKTDDQKTVVAVKPSSGNDKIDDVIDIVEDNDLSKSHIHYIYQGDIYAVPDKVTTPSDEKENPIISRMKEMVVEKARTNSTKSKSSSRDHINNEIEGPQSPTYNTPRSFTSDSIVVDTEYQEIGDIVKAMENDRNDYNVDKNGVDVQLSANDNAQGVMANGFNGYFSSSTNWTSANYVENGDIVDANTNLPLPSIEDGVTNGYHSDTVDGGALQVPTSSKYFRQQSGSSSKAGDTTFDEINNAGKRITDSAFEFLNTYLSDDEGGDGHTSP